MYYCVNMNTSDLCMMPIQLTTSFNGVVNYIAVEARSLEEAKQILQIQFDNDFVILSTKKLDQYVKVRAVSKLQHLNSNILTNIITILSQVGFSDTFISQILINVRDKAYTESALLRLIFKSIFEPKTTFSFAFDDETKHSTLIKKYLILGTEGCGKTTFVAKMVAKYIALDMLPVVISCDTQKTNGAERLAVILKHINIPLVISHDFNKVAHSIRENEYVMVDTGGVNIKKISTMHFLQKLIEETGVTPLLILRAGTAAVEAARICNAFGEIGVKYCALTSVENSQSYGATIEGILSCPSMHFVLFSESPYILSAPRETWHLCRLLMQRYNTSDGK